MFTKKLFVLLGFVVMTSCAQLPSRNSGCFEEAFPSQVSGRTVRGIGTTLLKHGAPRALNDVSLSFGNVVLGLVAIRFSAIDDKYFLLSLDDIHTLQDAVNKWKNISMSLQDEYRDKYNEPIAQIKVLDQAGKLNTIVVGISSYPRWYCYAKGAWSPRRGENVTRFVMGVPTALEYAPDVSFTGVEFDESGVAKLERVLNGLK